MQLNGKRLFRHTPYELSDKEQSDKEQSDEERSDEVQNEGGLERTAPALPTIIPYYFPTVKPSYSPNT
jgi:hypothetical protein